MINGIMQHLHKAFRTLSWSNFCVVMHYGVTLWREIYQLLSKAPQTCFKLFICKKPPIVSLLTVSPDGNMFFQHLAVYNNENLPNRIKIRQIWSLYLLTSSLPVIEFKPNSPLNSGLGLL